ncbi:N-acetylmuramoyl-L-alanine amidase [Clostridium amylolyticum]|uniref:N-acetylmuramoyl-L-alanine amidase n=1 Tax=Clostridium amylolyticum TaxID=1121298 RepID=A0A1M6KXK8_9CLOT|nr:N-acetylmuramoyl-L-alanine amidase [Clostridium amylolyticum]SHJ63697.1 N-acetylmuramoyl-L-alanine amidase [Clostridium amylolyticum]
MKIAYRGGHNYGAPGAVGIISELDTNREVLPHFGNYLKSLGHEILDVTPPYNMDKYEDLAYGVNKANAWGADLFLSLHCNNAYDKYNGSIGSEVCVYSEHEYAVNVSRALFLAGFTDDGGNQRRAGTKGLNINPRLYEVRNTKMPAMIVEMFFVEAVKDVENYRRLGPAGIAKVIAEGIEGKRVPEASKPTTPMPQPKPQAKPQYDFASLQAECNRQGFSKQAIDNYPGPNTLNGCPLVKQGARGNITKWIQERLIYLGYSLAYGADGIFGEGTKQAIMAFQRNNGLVADGIVGRNTWKKLLGL